jgi:GNAT superfamily N-acetyltransferase
MQYEVEVMQKHKTAWPWVVVGVVAVGGIGAWLFQDDLPKMRSSTSPSTSAGAGLETPAASPSRIVEDVSPAAPRYPLDAADAADAALPALADSDAAVWQALNGVFPADGLTLLMREHLIQRVVVHIDNLTQPSLPAAAMALKPVAGTLQVEPAAEGGNQLAAANAARYAPYVDAFTGADVQVLARTYRGFYPLIQQAWHEVGHPDGHFNDRLVAVIDHLLATPELASPPALELDGRGKYRFVDPDLQGRSVGQKAMLRLDTTQARVVKQQLRELRAALTRG